MPFRADFYKFLMTVLAPHNNFHTMVTKLCIIRRSFCLMSMNECNFKLNKKRTIFEEMYIISLSFILQTNFQGINELFFSLKKLN